MLEAEPEMKVRATEYSVWGGGIVEVKVYEESNGGIIEKGFKLLL